MKKSPLFLGLFALLFAGWMGYLAVQAWKYRHPPVVVSRAQLLLSKYDVVAEQAAAAEAGGAEMWKVTDVLFPGDGDGPKKGDTIKVWNLDECDGLRGGGPHVLPLTTQDGKYRVAGMPFDPGRVGTFRPRVYPATEEVRKQFAALRK